MTITKTRYARLDEAYKKINGTDTTIESDFEKLSDDLKFVLLNMSEGMASEPKTDDHGYAVYTLDRISSLRKSGSDTEFDMRKISVFLQDKKKEKMVNDWIQTVKENARIWRKE